MITETMKNRLKNMKPLPKWVFVFRNIFWWSVFGIFTILSAFAFALIEFLTLNEDWRLERLLDQSHIGVYLQTIPYFWILIYAVFLFIALHYMNNTKNAYKFPPLYFIVGSMFVSVFTGTVLYATHIPQNIDAGFKLHAPIYEQLVSHRENRWNQVENGRLAGEIQFMFEQEIQLKDFQEKQWILNIENAETPENFTMELGDKIRVFGERLDDESFRVQRIMPWSLERRPLMPPRMYKEEFEKREFKKIK